MKTHTFRDWYQAHNPRSWHLFRVHMAYRELGWKYFGFRPWRMFEATGFIPELVYYWKCRLWRQYNVVRVKSLPPTWVDRDGLLLHAAFTILCDVVEREDWLNHTVFYQEDADYRDRWQEIATLYDWWINKRPARLETEGAALESWHVAFQAAGGLQFAPSGLIAFGHSEAEEALSARHFQMEESGDQEDEEMLIRLCRIRQVLWT
jgi:hypothetical protein